MQAGCGLITSKHYNKPGMVVLARNPSIQEAEVGRSEFNAIVAP